MKTRNIFKRGIHFIQTFVAEPWFIPLVAVLAALNSFLIFFPIELLLVTRLFVKRDRWFRSVLTVATGSAAGSLLLAVFIKYNQEIITRFITSRSVSSPESWEHARQLIQQYGVLGVGLANVSFIPPSIAVAVAAIAKVDITLIFLASWIGRAVKYAVYGFLITRFPEMFKKA